MTDWRERLEIIYYTQTGNPLNADDLPENAKLEGISITEARIEAFTYDKDGKCVYVTINR